jgi:hypothetical protein
MDTALLCDSCAWFGVYRADVTERMRACPVCGRPVLSAREVGEDQWHAIGRELLGDDTKPPAKKNAER